MAQLAEAQTRQMSDIAKAAAADSARTEATRSAQTERAIKILSDLRSGREASIFDRDA
jgi:hypothetical protein